MEDNKDPIIHYTEKNGKFYKRAYKYLEAAKLMKDDIEWKIGECMEFGQVNVETYNLIDEIYGENWINPVTGKDRHLFGSAYTPSGWIEYTDTILEGLDQIYYVSGEIGTGKSTLLTKVFQEGLMRGLNVEVYHTPLEPEKIETIVIKDLNIGVTISEKAKSYECKQIDLNQYLNEEELEKYKEDIKEDKKIFNNLIDIASRQFSNAKANHDIIEEYYIPNMNFNAVEDLRKKVVERMLSYSE